MVDRVEILAYIELNDPAAGHPHRLAMEGVQRLMRRASWSKAVRAVEKLLLVDRFQHHGDCALQYLVLEGGDAQRSDLPFALRDVHTPYGRCAVRTGLRAVEQRSEVVLQVDRVLFCGLSIDARCTVLSRAPICLAHPLQVDVMSQRCERLIAQTLRQHRYPFE